MPSRASYRVVLGVTGGIAAYKAGELVRLFKKAGHEVRVVMTAGAEKFVGPLTFHSLSGEPVLRSLHEGGYDLSATAHIDLARWGDLLVVAPATANFLAKYAHGMSDDALLTEALAFRGPVLIAPAMNTRMWDAPATRANLATLTSRGVHFAGPAAGGLACGEEGAGKMSEPAEIFAAAEALLRPGAQPLRGKHVLITSGPTRAYIDDVRFLTNRSSGKMGHALALAAESFGAEVTLITGPVEPRFAALPRGKVIRVETGPEMLEHARAALPSAHAVFGVAAVADFEALTVHPGKLRREGALDLPLRAAADVLATLGREKRAGQLFCGFAAEPGEGEPELAKAREKIARKNLDFLALNNVARRDIGFDADENEIRFLRADGTSEMLPKASKAEIARALLTRVFAGEF